MEKLSTIPRQKIVFFTGAGVSKESGIPTFRDADGLWNKFNPEMLASASGFFEDMDTSLTFYNERRANLAKCQPNHAHKVIAELEKNHDVAVITQNVDDLHERAGSTKVIHLHGELTKITSSYNRMDVRCIKEYPLELPIRIGDMAEDGSQMRPFVVMFGEFLSGEDTEAAKKAIKESDIFVVIGTSLKVHPAAGFVKFADSYSLKYIIDPADFDSADIAGFHHIKETATLGINKFIRHVEEVFEND